MLKVCFKSVWFRLCSLLNGRNYVFQPTWKTFFFAGNDVTGGRDLSQNVQACFMDPMIPSVTC